MVVIYFGVALIVCRYAKKNMYNDLDIVLYTACALENETMSHQQIHDVAYEQAKQDLGIAKFKNLTDSSKFYRHSIYKSSENFYSQLPFYRVKPLYVYFLKIADSFGVSPVIFSTYLNLLTYFAIGIVLLFYLIRFIGFYKGWLISFCIMLMPMVLDTIKNNTPDMLSSFLVLTAVLSVLSGSELRRHIAIVVFCLCIFIRPESVILVAVFCGLSFTYKQQSYSKKYLLLLFGASISCYLFVSFYYHAYPWSLLYKHSFMGYIPDLKNAEAALTFNDYIYGLRFIPNTVFYSDFFLIPLFLILPFLVFARPYWKNKLFVMAQVVLVSVIVRIMLFPDLSIRFYTGVFLISVVLFCRMMFGNEKPKVVNNFNSN